MEEPTQYTAADVEELNRQLGGRSAKEIDRWSGGRPFLAVSCFALLVFALVTVIGCGDDDDDSADAPSGTSSGPSEYLVAMEAAFDDFREDGRAITEEFPSELDDPAAARDAFQASADLSLKLKGEIEALSPPPELEDAHRQAITGLEMLAAAQQAVADDISDNDSADEIQSAMDAHREAAVAGSGSLTNACEEMQGVAGDDEIDVGLNCR